MAVVRFERTFKRLKQNTMTTKQAIEIANKYLEFRRVDVEHYPESKHKTKAEQLTQAIEILIQQAEKMEKVREYKAAIDKDLAYMYNRTKLVPEGVDTSNALALIEYVQHHQDKLTKIINE